MFCDNEITWLYMCIGRINAKDYIQFCRFGVKYFCKMTVPVVSVTLPDTLAVCVLWIKKKLPMTNMMKMETLEIHLTLIGGVSFRIFVIWRTAGHSLI